MASEAPHKSAPPNSTIVGVIIPKIEVLVVQFKNC